MAAPSTDITKLVLEPIDPLALAAYVRGNGDGAMVIFDGFVRDHSKNRRTLYLKYEAYEPMALAKIQEIAAHLHNQFPIHRVAMVHRLGRLEIGETKLAMSESPPPRAAPFDACRYAIDTLKCTVPIWKKEYFEDGSVWADGELPPVPSAPSATSAVKPAS